MRKLLMLLLSAGLFTSAIQAQKISGTVTDDQGKGFGKNNCNLIESQRFFSSQIWSNRQVRRLYFHN